MKRLNLAALAGPIGFGLVIFAFGCGGSNNTPYDPIIGGTTTTTTGGGTTGDFTMTPASQTLDYQDLGTDKVIPKTLGRITGATVKFPLTLTSKNGFAGTVNLQVTNPDPNDFTTSLPSSKSLTANGTANIELDVTGNSTNVPIQDFIFKVTASAGSLSHSANCTVHVVTGDFSLTPTPQTKTYINNTGGQNGFGPTFFFDLNANSIGNLTGDITLSVVAPTGSGSSDFSTKLPAKVTIASAGGTAPFQLEVDTDDPDLIDGTYTFTVNGTAHGVTRSAECTVVVVEGAQTKPKPH